MMGLGTSLRRTLKLDRHVGDAKLSRTYIPETAEEPVGPCDIVYVRGNVSAQHLVTGRNGPCVNVVDVANTRLLLETTAQPAYVQSKGGALHQNM